MNGGIYVQKISLSGPLSNKKSGLLQPPTASVPPFAFRLHPSLGALGGLFDRFMQQYLRVRVSMLPLKVDFLKMPKSEKSLKFLIKELVWDLQEGHIDHRE